MNRKALSLLIAVVMLMAVVPVVLPVTSAEQISVPNLELKLSTSHQSELKDFDSLPLLKRTGLIWVSPEQYARITGTHFKTMDAKALAEALKYAPFYPGRSASIAPRGLKLSQSSESLPPQAINDLYLPPIGDQGYVGSCNAWSSTYYVWTYMINWWRNNPYPRSVNEIMNPTFTYNLINGGTDEGSNPWDAMTLISTIGAVPISAFPLYTYPPFPDDYLWVWPNLTQWMMAPHNSGNDYMWLASMTDEGYQIPGNWYIIDLTNDTQWQYLKELLAAGYVVQYAYIVTLPFYIVNIFESADDILQHLEYYASYIANATNNQTYYQWVNETYLSNQTFVQGLKNTFMRYTVTVAFYNFTKETGWWKVWAEYFKLKYNRSINFVIGGHAVTIVGYDDRVKTPDGYGVIKIANSWGQDFGNGGYFYVSYKDIRFGEESYGMAWVYIPKAANYQPKMMSVIGIHHPVRGEIIDGTYDPNTYEDIKVAGIPVGVSVNGTPVWEFPYLKFWIDYVPVNYIPVFASNIPLLYQYLPQAHPFPDSPMAFDVSELSDRLVYYMDKTGETPLYVDLYTNISDIIPDNITGYLYNFTLLYQGPDGNYYPIATLNVSNVSIPDGGWKVVDVRVPVVQYWKGTTDNGASIDFGNLNVSVISIVPLKSAEVIIDGTSYNLSAENGGYYYYATRIDQKLKLPAGTYNYTVVVTYPNGKKVALPERTVTIKEPVVQILSPEPKVYNTSEISIAVNVVDVLNITKVSAEVGGKTYNLTYNQTLGLYTGNLNLTNGSYTLRIIALDVANNTGIATVQFVVHTNAKVVSVPVNNGANVTVGVIGGSANVTAENNTIVAKVKTSNGTVTVEVPVVNNFPIVIINTTAIKAVVTGQSNISLAAGWNATVKSVESNATLVKTENNKKLYSVTIKANVSLGENGVAVIALRNINISKIYVWKNGQKIQLTTDKNNPLGYYYTQGNLIFVVLKEDPIIEADGYFKVKVSLPSSANLFSELSLLNYVYYHNFIKYNATYSELYEKAIAAGVDNETLQKAEKLHELAVDEYKEAVRISGGAVVLNSSDPRVFIHLRKAYVCIKEAVEILGKALSKG